MPKFYRDHIILSEGANESLPYTSIVQGRSKVKPRTNLDRIEQGTKVKADFTAAVDSFQENAPDVDFVYIVFRSAPGFLLDLAKLDNQNYRLASYSVLNNDPGDEIYEATVLLNKKAIGQFLTKIDQYIYENSVGNNPKHQSLIANLEQIRVATLENFWTEPELRFPGEGEETWWELWIDRDEQAGDQKQLTPLFRLMENAGVQVGTSRWLSFPENLVFLVKGTAAQLASTILYTDSLSELRKPRETTDYFSFLDKPEQKQWIDELLARLDIARENTNVAICLLDTGVNRAHPLLEPLIPERHLDVIEPEWDRSDTHRQGHGTPMAGLAFFGDLADALTARNRLTIYHHLESIKIIERSQPNDPQLYGAITLEAIARAEVMNANFKRIVCLAVTTEELVHRGQPSSWSAAIDQFSFGGIEALNSNTLIFVSAGNLPLEERINFPESNKLATIEDPAQAFNAISVGAYTNKDQIDLARFPGALPIAQRGDMSPSNTTSVTWFREWPRKPDIVMEGGNHGIHHGAFIDPDSLQLLSTGKGGLGRPWFTTFGDTSAATALASKFAAELYLAYPDLWPETIRGLIIHAADWTPAMLGGHDITGLDPDQKIALIASVGYGVPNFQKARYSASNSLSLIIQRLLKPYKFEEGRVKTDEFHLIDLPWPAEVLSELLDTPVRLKVTLSYFIEPNPGNRQYDLAASYRSHGLRFKMIDTYESVEAFSARISKESREEDQEYTAEGSEHWILGNQIRDKGSVHKDIWVGSAADLATRNKIAVYSVGGWWKSRKGLKRYNNLVPYALIVNIETPDSDIDIYTPVLVSISV